MDRKVKRLVFGAVICCIAAVGFFNHNPVINAAGSATVNLNAPKQSIRGFGASSAWCGAIGDSVMNSLYKDLGYSILRLRIEEGIGDAWKSGNFSKWAPELSNAKKASERGAIVFASPWNPPASMQENFAKSGDSDAKRLRYDKYSEYVQYLNAYVKYMKDNGVNLYAISVQNEPDYAQDWTWWTPQEMLNFMKNYAGSINCKVMAPESFQYLKNISDPILNDATAFANLDILGFHLYGTPLSQFSYPLFQQKGAGKEAWMTEHYFDNDNLGNIMNMGKEIHDCMVTGNMNAYVYWWITWPNGLGTASGQIYKRAYVLGQFAKYIRPGYNRVDATANPATNVYVSAYTGSGKVVMVAVNTGTAAVSQNFVLQNGTATRISSYQTTNSSNMAVGPSYQVTGGSFTATLPAQSITTFVGDLGGTVTPTPTAIPTPTQSITVTPTPMPTPTPTKSSVVTPTPTSSQTTGCSVSYSQSDWGSGATVSITIKNNGSSTINGWTLAWKFAGNQTITNMWNGTYTQSGTAITVKNASYNGVIPAKGSVSFGFGLSYSGANAKPTSFTLNGATCEAE